MIALTDFSVLCTTIVCQSVGAIGVSQLVVVGQTVCHVGVELGNYVKLE